MASFYCDNGRPLLSYRTNKIVLVGEFVSVLKVELWQRLRGK